MNTRQLKQIQIDDFEIEYGADDELTDVSKFGFTDKHGQKWETWGAQKDGSFKARRADGAEVEVIA